MWGRPVDQRARRGSTLAIAVEQFFQALDVVDRVAQYLDFGHALIGVRTSASFERLECLVHLA